MSKPRSIISAAAARRVLEELNAGVRISMFAMGSVFVHARRTEKGSLRLSLNGKARKFYGHTSHPYRERVVYLRVADEARSISTAFEVFRREALERTPLLDARERLYRLAESRQVPDSWADTPPIPNPQDYDSMTLEDVAAWTPLVEALPLLTKVA